MGCGCGGTADKKQEFVIRWADGSVSQRYPAEPDAQIALARSGKMGTVKRADP